MSPVFVCIIAGRSATETAASSNTVSNHTAWTKAKLDVSNRSEIITCAHRTGLIE